MDLITELVTPAEVTDAEFEVGRGDAIAGRAPIVDLAQMPEDLGAIAYHAGYDTGSAQRARRHGPALAVLPGGVR